jgi:hypothetical protein
VCVSFSFIDLGELKQGACNGGHYMLGSITNVFFWSRERVLARLGSPFIDNWEGTAIYPSVRHECRVLTHMAGLPTCRVCPSPYVGFRSPYHVASYPLIFARGGAPRENHYHLSMHDVPSIGPDAPPARG